MMNDDKDDTHDNDDDDDNDDNNDSDDNDCWGRPMARPCAALLVTVHSSLGLVQHCRTLLDKAGAL